MNIDPYVDYAVEYANKYYPQTIQTGGLARVAGKDEAETAAILDYLEKKNFGDADSRAAIRAVLDELIAGIEVPANPEAVSRDVVYFSGSKGSRQLLVKAAEEGLAPEVQAVLDNPKIFDGNFGRYKKLFLKHQAMFAGEEPYGKWRGIISGIDNGMKKFCPENGVGQIIDNAGAPVSEEGARESVAQFRRLANDGKGSKAKLHMFAIALTPEQAVEEAKKIGVSEEEARQDAHNFAAFFPTLQREFDDITLYNRDMQVIYKQVDHQARDIDPNAMRVWKESVGANVGLMTIPPRPRGAAER